MTYDQEMHRAAYGSDVVRVTAYRCEDEDKPYMWRVTFYDGHKTDFWRMCGPLPSYVKGFMADVRHYEDYNEETNEWEEVWSPGA